MDINIIFLIIIYILSIIIYLYILKGFLQKNNIKVVVGYIILPFIPIVNIAAFIWMFYIAIKEGIIKKNF